MKCTPGTGSCFWQAQYTQLDAHSSARVSTTESRSERGNLTIESLLNAAEWHSAAIDVRTLRLRPVEVRQAAGPLRTARSRRLAHWDLEVSLTRSVILEGVTIEPVDAVIKELLCLRRSIYQLLTPGSDYQADGAHWERHAEKLLETFEWAKA
ncbi:MAG: hypothetical protein QME94_07035 [Anaerolineae bacterium]|nr:hypothetical protein [Anaerolineae bacterium]